MWSAAALPTKPTLGMAPSHAGEQDVPFTLTLGDNFYYHGIRASEHGDFDNSFRFRTTFEEVFTSEHLQNNDHFRVVAGNHDHYGNVSLQIAYTQQSNRWHFPSMYYTFTETAADGADAQSEKQPRPPRSQAHVRTLHLPWMPAIAAAGWALSSLA